MQQPPNTAASPAQRLAASRAALLSHMMPQVTSKRAAGSPTAGTQTTAARASHDQPPADSAVMQFANHALAGWWQHHPLHLAVDVARPYLAGYARHKPVQLLAMAAALGALAVVVKPWRLVSAAGVAALAVKSTNLSATVLSFFTRAMATRRGAENPPSSKGTP